MLQIFCSILRNIYDRAFKFDTGLWITVESFPQNMGPVGARFVIAPYKVYHDFKHF